MVSSWCILACSLLSVLHVTLSPLLLLPVSCLHAYNACICASHLSYHLFMLSGWKLVKEEYLDMYWRSLKLIAWRRRVENLEIGLSHGSKTA